MTDKVAIPGIKGSFHYQVVQEFYGREVVVDECRSFSGRGAKSAVSGSLTYFKN